MQTSKLRRLHTDLFSYYKILFALVRANSDELFASRTLTDINISLINAKLLQAYVHIFFSEHVVDIWNSRPDVVNFDSFYRATPYASAAYAVVVCLFVCLSQVGVLLQRLSVCSITQTKPHDSPGTLVF